MSNPDTGEQYDMLTLSPTATRSLMKHELIVVLNVAKSALESSTSHSKEHVLNKVSLWKIAESKERKQHRKLP
jgi:hypothetical protein